MHGIYRVISVEIVRPFTLRVLFDDNTEQEIFLGDILEGSIFGPLRDEKFFNQVAVDPERHTLVWPNGADFDPETLHGWPKYKESMRQMAKKWAAASTRVA